MTKKEVIKLKFKDIYEQIEEEVKYNKGADVSTEFLASTFAYQIVKEELERLSDVAKPVIYFGEADEEDEYADFSSEDDLTAFEEEFFKAYRSDKEENNFIKDFLKYVVLQAKTNKNEITKAMLSAVKLCTYSPSKINNVTVEEIEKIDISTIYELDVISFQRTLEVIDNICDKNIELEKLNNSQLDALRKVLKTQEEEYKEKLKIVYGRPSRERWNGESYWEQNVVYEPSEETVEEFEPRYEKTQELIEKIDELLNKDKNKTELELN